MRQARHVIQTSGAWRLSARKGKQEERQTDNGSSLRRKTKAPLPMFPPGNVAGQEGR